MAYAGIEHVSALCRNLLGDSPYFDTSSSPTAVDVEFWLNAGCGIIEAHIANLGYYTPIASNLPLYSWLSELNALYAASRAELTRINVTLGPGERTRGQVFDEMFNAQLKLLSTLNLSTMGATVIPAGGTTARLYAGGISALDKASYEHNTDRVTPRFKRNVATSGVISDTYDVV